MSAFWNETPLLRFLLFLITGILVAVYAPLLTEDFSIAICLLLVAVMLFIQFTRRKKYALKIRWLNGLAAYLFSFFIGYTITLSNTESRYPHHFRNISNATAYIGYIEQPLNEKERSF